MRALLVSMLLFCAPLAADMAQVQAEPNLEKRSHAALDLAERSLKSSRQAYAAGDIPQATALLEELKQSVELAEKSLQETGKDPIKSPKHFKFAEIKTADLLKKIDAYMQDTNIADRPMVESAKERLQEVHDRLLHGIMTGKKR